MVVLCIDCRLRNGENGDDEKAKTKMMPAVLSIDGNDGNADNF